MQAKFTGDAVEAEIELPEGTTGVFVWGGKEVALRAGAQRVKL